MKTRGILAVLGVSAGLRYSRAKLQDKLWSDRAPEQGNASLRQALAELRRNLGRYRDVMLSGPGWIGLDAECVDVILEPDCAVPARFVEFAEDINIRDPEFEDWLLLQRQHYANVWSRLKPKPSNLRPSLEQGDGRTALCLLPSHSGNVGIDNFIDAAVHDAAMRAADLAPLKVYKTQDLNPGALGVQAHGFSVPGGFVLNLSVSRLATKENLSSQTITVDEKEMSAGFHRISAELTLAVLHAVSSSHYDNAHNAEAHLPISDIFSFSKERLLASDAVLARRPDIPSNLALRAYIRNTLLLERFVKNQEEIRAEATEFATLAIEKAPQSATALSIAAMVAMRNRRFELSADLADQAIRIDPSNPLSRSSLSAALTFMGRHEDAYQEATRLVKEPLRVLSPASWSINCAIAAVRTGRLDEALRYATLSHNYAPGYRPALRFLAALHFHHGNDAEALTALTKLRQLEPDFSLELMASDGYPVATLRDTNLLSVTQSQLI